MLEEFCRMIRKYWYFMGINIALVTTLSITSTDINMGMDGTHSYEWVTNEGWMNLLNKSNHLTNEQKAAIISKVTYL